MKFTDKVASQPSSKPFFTFEFFPPRTDLGFDNLVSRISRLAILNPLGVSITWGAGGATKERSLELASLTQNEYSLDTILHLTCTNMEVGSVDEALKDAKERGIQNILALRGDPPRGQEEWIPSDTRFTHGVDLVSYIRESYGDYFCIGIAAYPDGHPDRLITEGEELNYLKSKVDAGADFIVTQLFYDTDRFIAWMKKVRERGITIPIIPGIMPIQTYSSFQRLTKLTGTQVPSHISTRLREISHDDQLIKNYGVTLAVEMIRKLVAEGGVPGVHFCTLNLEKSVQRVLEELEWTGTVTHPTNRLIADDTNKPAVEVDSDLVASAATATQYATHSLATMPGVDGDTARGEANKAATWDDFPNGRFGDFKSPAFGVQDHWGGTTLGLNDVLKQWKNPKTLEDLTQIFLDHLHSKIPTTPFSPTPLSAESLMILPELEELTKRGWWTVGSQPAVNGKSSSDEVVGWGPKAGYVFQKCFVEFFCEEKDLALLEELIKSCGKGWVQYYAGNFKGDYRSNVPADSRNAVTWGVFPGQEIAQTTIIEGVSFMSWKEDAFLIWSDWASCYRPGSEERRLIESVRDKRWLINIIHHDYQNPRALWDLILGIPQVNGV